MTLPYDPVWSALEWAKENCPSYITNDVHSYNNDMGYELGDVDRIDYFFSDEHDAVMFALRWS